MFLGGVWETNFCFDNIWVFIFFVEGNSSILWRVFNFVKNMMVGFLGTFYFLVLMNFVEMSIAIDRKSILID